MAALEGLEARVSALEASHADYRTVLSAVNSLGADQREMAGTLQGHGKRLDGVESRLTSIETKMDDTNARVRSLEGFGRRLVARGDRQSSCGLPRKTNPA